MPNAAKVLFAELSRQDLVNQVPAWLVSWTSPTSATPTYTSTAVAVTANQQVTTKDGYTMGVCPSGDTTFSSATIAYTG